MSENNRSPSSRRIVEITDEDETILIAFVPVGAQLILFTRPTEEGNAPMTTTTTTTDDSDGPEDRSASAAYEAHRLEWGGVVIEVRYTPDWSPSYRDVYGYPLAHLEIESVIPAKAPLPMTETGYRSHFGAPADIDAEGGPVEFVREWLDHTAQMPAWKAATEERRQFALF